MTLHHSFDDDRGASGVTIKIAKALRAMGCRVDLFGFGEAFAGPVTSVLQSARFPIRVVKHLVRHAHHYDVIDASSGDAWLWAKLGRPSIRRSKAALVTRSHGLEHIQDEQYREDVRSGREFASWRYRLYHGGFRLWEVEQSMRLSDHTIVLNHADHRAVTGRIGVAAGRASMVRHGVSQDSALFERALYEGETVQIAFIGTWIGRKGTSAIVAAFEGLVRTGRAARLLLLGTIFSETDVLRSFDVQVRHLITVVPEFRNEDLHALLGDASIVLMLSRSEGFGLGLIEGMAAGLVPIATPTGGAAESIVDGSNGYLVPVGGSTDAVVRLIALFDDADRRAKMGVAARETARLYNWASVATQTIAVYETACRNRKGS